MKQVTMDKSDFRQIVEDNKAQHEALFHEASAAFYEKFSQELTYIAGEVELGNMNYAEAQERIYQMDCPQGHCDQYQEILDQIEYEVGETITLDNFEFTQYVKDEWGWKGAFAASYNLSTGKSL